MKEKINLKDHPIFHSEKAYEDGYYFEATTVLHGYMESQMREIFHLNAAKITDVEFSLTWDINEKLTYRPLVHVLFVLQYIDKNEFDTLTAFNAMRNEIIHKFYHEPYDSDYYGVSKKKFDSCYKKANKLSYKMNEKLDMLV